MNIEILETAEAELAEAVAFYNGESEGLGYEFAAEFNRTLVRIVEHPQAWTEPLRMTCSGVGVDILIAHRNWEVAMLEEAAIVPWQTVGIPSVRVEALAAMKVRAGGPQDLVDAGRLEALPGFDPERFAAWKKRLRVRGSVKRCQ